MTLQALHASISELQVALTEENALLERLRPAEYEKYLIRKCLILQDLKRHRRENMMVADAPEFGEKLRQVRALIAKNHRLLEWRLDELQKRNAGMA